MTSGSPSYDFNSNACVYGNKILTISSTCHVFKFFQTLFKLRSSGWILSTSSNKLHSVQSSLFVHVIEQLNDLVELVQIVNLNLAFLELSKGS